ncbi:hypothetical protein SAMN02745223_03114 [Devosia limi DSM 17137]|uniref:Uncharacterized protein n=1 Tax=Devosia limi DSM 17137 TaxID=1121477 RepID=A0A1M5D347_9HYPH|nr:hypothetical protein SAMN02745223_03114 [Devosia limi DSM 17137]
MSGAQASFARVPLADGTLVATEEIPADDLIPSLLATSDVLGTGWYAADAARVRPGMTVAVVGDGAVGLMGVLAARQMGWGQPDDLASTVLYLASPASDFLNSQVIALNGGILHQI